MVKNPRREGTIEGRQGGNQPEWRESSVGGGLRCEGGR